MMSEGRTKTKHNFTSYVKQVTDGKFPTEDYKPTLLSGEIEAARANHVCMYTASFAKQGKVLSERKGILIITNFRLSFVFVDIDDDQPPFQSNRFLGSSDVSLSNIDRIYQVVDKKKKLICPQVKNSNKIDKIRIICKNFKTFTFGFQLSDVGKGKYIADALVKFAYPARHNLLFLYQFKENSCHGTTSNATKMFRKKTDWLQELERCNATAGWRVYSKDCRISDSSLPMHFVVPKHLSDMDYNNISKSFRNDRSAIWVWGYHDAALVRLAELNPDITNTTVENILLEHVRRCDPQKRQPRLLELYKILPSIQDVNLSYIKLRDLCTPDNDQQFMAQDGRFYSMVEKSYWLFYVSLCLKHSDLAAKMLIDGQTVVLQEINGRDMCGVISSLVQLLLDKSYRTLQGFQNLIQKEWITLGHPFSDRIGHVATVKATERSPIFLLFLDCVWQLLQQFPKAFEFSETFLTTLWDSLFLPIFDTFQFNSETERYNAVHADHIILRPVWDWSKQFEDKDLALFTNPLYQPDTLEHGKIPLNSIDKEHLQPQYCLRDIELWQQCYFRWMPHVEIKYGGIAQSELLNHILLNNIRKLRRTLGNHEPYETVDERMDALEQILSSMIVQTRDPDAASETTLSISSFFPFTTIAPSTEIVCTELLIANNGINFSHDSMYETSSLND
ncbi:myotubularin-related protein 10-like isoform X1 [Anopheles albimanus]|uniref:Myotubularin phosphatase domain-containing protein n=1 Tax=Anopheles albimanus TaxID=7167 RepID=A0A8W7JGG7_ANOAL|nr:myotubularin-related protein 10-like isoform X1 [Anopheles albimanus]